MVPFRAISVLCIVAMAVCGLGSGVMADGHGERLRVMLRWDQQFQFAGIYAAEWAGYFDEAGLDVEIMAPFAEDGRYLSTIDAVRSGQADFALAGGDLLVALDEANDLAVVAPIFQRSPVRIISLATSGIETPVDLADNTVRRTLGDLSDVELLAVLKKEGVDPGSFRTLAHATYKPPFQDILSGSAVAYAGYAWTAIASAQSAGVAIKMLDPATYGVDFYADTLFTTQDFLRERPDDAAAFAEAVLRGWAYALENREAMITRISALPRQYPAADPEAMNRLQADWVERLMSPDYIAIGHMNVDRWRRMHADMAALGLVSGPFAEDSFVPPAEIATWAHAVADAQVYLIAQIAFFILAGLLVVLLAHALLTRRSLKVAQDQLLKAQEIAQLGHWYLKLDSGKLTWSDQLFEIFDLPKSAFDGTTEPFYRTVHPDDRAFVRQYSLEQTELRQSHQFFHRIIRSDGEVRWIQERVKIILDRAGEPVEFQGTAQDVTEERRLQHALDERQNQLAEIAGNLPVIVFQLSLNHDDSVDFLYVSPGSAALLEVPAEALCAESDLFFDLLQEGDRARMVAEMRAAHHRAASWTREAQLTLPSGQDCWIQFGLTSRETDGGALLGNGVAIDVTARKRLEVALRRSEVRYASVATEMSTIIETANAPIIGFDMQGRVTVWNRKIADMSRVDTTEITGQRIGDVFAETSRFSFEDILGIMHDPSGVGTFEIRLIPNANEPRNPVDVLLNVTARRDTEGEIIGFIGVGQDLTQIREWQLQVMQTAKLATLGEISTGLAHEINQPLTVIKMSAANALRRIARDRSDPEDLTQRLEKIVTQTDKASVIIDHLRSFGRVPKEEPYAFDPAAPIRDAVTLAQNQASARDIALTASVPDVLPEVIGHPTLVEQVVLALLNNASDAITYGECAQRAIEVHAHARAPDNAVEITISDSGPGIPENFIDKIFEPFFTTKPSGKGTGLGLSISYRIIRDMGGTLSAETVAGGAAFKIVLPTGRRPATPLLDPMEAERMGILD